MNHQSRLQMWLFRNKNGDIQLYIYIYNPVPEEFNHLTE